jgi:predicted GNAT family acetyltransferase
MTTQAFVIKREPHGGKHRYVTVVDGYEAEMTYLTPDPKTIVIDHTLVPPGLKGRGVGQAMVLRAVEDARQGGYKIHPTCPFAKAQIEKHKEWQDVLAR